MSPLVALAHPIFAIVAAILVGAVFWAVLRRFVRLALFFLIGAVVLWLVFFLG